MTNPFIIETQHVTKQFGEFTAVQDVTYSLAVGEAAGVIGPNGAGKSTFFNLLTGLHRPSSGAVHFMDKDVTNLRAARRVGLGMVRTFQLVSVFDSLTVLDNLTLAVVRSGPDFRRTFHLMMGTAHPKHVMAACEEALDTVGLGAKVDTVTAELSYGDKRMLEIAMALALKPKLLLLDEPLAGLSDVEIVEVVKLIRKVKTSLSLIIIEHKISRIVDLVSRLSVMHEGALIAEGDPSDILCDPLVRRVYWGEPEPVCEVPQALGD